MRYNKYIYEGAQTQLYSGVIGLGFDLNNKFIIFMH